ncbi:hypothetical protein C7387_3827 [Yokenella regensburgei]|jgi:hypothetical protein|uniref:Addiction module toxin RelE n=1 Tax=Yokenella regensburgei TaxID=158877 RepID=A0AB38G062_9ENTR|nr:hypothetical protein C7387_3827 [Yokenella regensburgei]SQA64322.1 Uncharacterised protein [Yokenella regensburgei]SQB01921.1 Uncharacterised protein [Yokenella regensburgei]SUQ03310.1 Uncharacterised protein [Yokenella regensburgei]VFS27977.1 Uncharacterised protein [Yokenella regensburgei]
MRIFSLLSSFLPFPWEREDWGKDTGSCPKSRKTPLNTIYNLQLTIL